MTVAVSADNTSTSRARDRMTPTRESLGGRCPHHLDPNRLARFNTSWGASGRPEQVGQKKSTKTLFYDPVTKSRNSGRRQQVLASLLADPLQVRREAPGAHIQIRTGEFGTPVPREQLLEHCTYELLELRRPTAYMYDRKTSGRFAFSSELGRYGVWFESLVEREWLTEVRWREQPAFVATQACSLAWNIEGVTIEHIPDMIFELGDGQRVVCDAHLLDDDGHEDPDFLAKARLTAAFCESVGWAYRMGGAIPAQRMTNLNHINAFADTSMRLKLIALELTEASILPRSVQGVISWGAARSYPSGDVLAALFHLLWWQQAWVNLDYPIASYTEVRDQLEPRDLNASWLRPVWSA